MKKINIRGLVQRAFSFALAATLAVGIMPAGANMVLAADTADISYSYSSSVETGTIRYISQVPGSASFDSRYWGDWENGGPNSSGARSECGTASVSMALSAVGINKTPKDILDAHNGITHWDWDGAVRQYPSLDDGISRYLNSNGKYSPMIVHFTAGYSSGTHYVLLVGGGNGSYTVLDPWEESGPIWTLTSDDARFNSIDESWQYYNENAVIKPKVVIPSGVTQTNVQLQATKNDGSVVRTGPAKTTPVVRRLDRGTIVKAIGYTVNQYGHVWYFLEDGTYIYSDNVRIDKYLSAASVSDVAAPSGTLQKGSIFVLKGIISGQGLSKVTVNVVGSNGSIVLSACDTVSGSYSLQGSAIDCAMTFNTLPSGNYRYEIIATESLDTGKQCVTFDTVLYTSEFSIA